jgi:hypothetical protein
MARALWLGVFAVVPLAAEFNSARADVPGPDGTYHPKPWGYGAPPPGWFERNSLPNPPQPTPPGPAPQPNPQPQPFGVDPNGRPYPPPAPRDPPKRTGPFRSCGSGMGLGLAGIGAAWGMFWLGNRFAGRVSRRTNGERAC